ncbi:HEAT repeat domain-containing protein [Kitasatospora sp. NBC_01287]|uniref:HEAT repeat domain-containing protein n=1 Tax=Kitasatospora sp. NBC_01287 TaxID=2903573 RepID=UPI002257CA4F|nr:HEAT repeat domain-containing protein [Kitasatospora sp. NBC_01287]MCX4744282.1 HEAT repeat domain-containing protein [Kitasatospora sp. NBC_01287]
MQLSLLVQRVLATTGAEHDLSMIRIRLLGILRDRRAGMLELGRHLGLDKSAMTGLVSRAEKRDLVERSPSPHDGRAVLVSLTPHGRQLTDRCTAEITSRVTELTGHLTAGQRTQRTQLTRLATALVRGREAGPGQAGPGRGRPGRAGAGRGRTTDTGTISAHDNGGRKAMALPIPADADLGQHPGALVAQACSRLGHGQVADWCVGLLAGRLAPDDPEHPSLAWLGGAPAAAALRRGRLTDPDQDHWPRVWAVRALRYCWTPAAAPVVGRALADPSWRVRETAAKLVALRELGEAVELLAALADDEIPRVRAAAVRGLGVVGEGEHAPVVRAALDDPFPGVATAAETALAELCHRLDRDL